MDKTSLLKGPLRKIGSENDDFGIFHGKI